MSLVEGGFALGSASITPPSYPGNTAGLLTAYRATVLNGLVAAMLSGGWSAAGWTDGVTITEWTGSSLSHARRTLTHEDGATLFLGIFGPWSDGTAFPLTGNGVHANNAGSTDGASNTGTPGLLIAYAPPGVSASISGTDNPWTNSSWFADARMFKWIALGAETTMNSTLLTPIEFFWGVQGDTFWLTRKYSTSAFGTFASTAVAGSVVIPAESADTGPLSTYALIKLGLNTASMSATQTASSEAQAYDLAGNRKIFYTTYNSIPISSANATAAPWYKVPVQLANTTVNHMRAGSGYKGTVDPIILSACSSQVTARRRLTADAKYTHLTGGIVLGYQTGAAAW